MSAFYLEIFSDDYREKFEEHFSAADQAKGINELKAIIAMVLDGSEEDWRAIGVLTPEVTTSDQMMYTVRWFLERCYWQLSKLLRFSLPTRIAEAEPFLRQMLRDYTEQNDADDRDVLPMLYLACAIQKAPEKEQEALQIFRDAFEYYEGPLQEHKLGVKSELWARANYARLLRKTGAIASATAQEKKIRDYILRNTPAYPPSLYRRMATDMREPDSVKYTLEHHAIQRAWRGIVEFPLVPLRMEEGGVGAVPKVHKMKHASRRRASRR
ncbi:hypothetical protein BKA93DRAFT_915961 [Sparassis latifolia]|uniref:Uncharacterized protein n=1 Tax=Sparassis crispa TaxID=139825 RepID=A0A401GSD2_9APHY|nr:hypothetical protein SCP_0702890 [Sparassis crispa]GBE85103.1 hypothetical protein SCP_0702890 [Sparassis crispa]